MPTRKASWAIAIWTGFMAIGFVAAASGIGGDCAGLSGSDLGACTTAAWGRGAIGLTLLALLWLAVLAPLAMVWSSSRPKTNGGPGPR